MRVLYVDCSIGFGGAFKSIALTMRGLPGIDKLMVSSQDPELVKAWFPNLAVQPYRRVVNYRTRERVESLIRLPGLNWLAVKAFAAADLASIYGNCLRLLWVIRRGCVDLVHVNNGFVPDAIFAAHLADVPCVVHLRDFPREDGIQNRAMLRRGVYVIAVSDAIASSLAESAVPAGHISTIHDPVDLGTVTTAALARERIRGACGIADGAVVVGIFGRVVRWKGQLEFARAAESAMRVYPKLAALIVGDESDGGPEYLDEVRAFIMASDMADRFVLTGYRANVDEYFAAVDIVVHASTWPEPFGMVVAEGMAAGRAVIAIDAGGPREIVQHGVDGLLVPLGDSGAMQNAMIQLAVNPELRQRMGRAARRKAAALFSVEANAISVGTVYRAALARHGSRPAHSAAS